MTELEAQVITWSTPITKMTLAEKRQHYNLEKVLNPQNNDYYDGIIEDYEIEWQESSNGVENFQDTDENELILKATEIKKKEMLLSIADDGNNLKELSDEDYNILLLHIAKDMNISKESIDSTSKRKVDFTILEVNLKNWDTLPYFLLAY